MREMCVSQQGVDVLAQVRGQRSGAVSHEREEEEEEEWKVRRGGAGGGG